MDIKDMLSTYLPPQSPSPTPPPSLTGNEPQERLLKLAELQELLYKNHLLRSTVIEEINRRGSKAAYTKEGQHGTPQMTQGTPAMSHATLIMRNVTPTQRMNQGSPNHSAMAPTPVPNQAIMGTPQMGGGMGLTPQQQQMLMQHRKQLLAQQGHLGHGQFTPQQLVQLQANAHVQQEIQYQQQNHQGQHQNIPNAQAYQAQMMRAQYAQMQIAQQQQPQGQQTSALANVGQVQQNFQGVTMAQRYSQLYQQRLLRLRQDMATRFMPQYGPPTQYPPQIAQQYRIGLERSAKSWVRETMRRERDATQQHHASQVAAVQARFLQKQQQNLMHNGMGK